MPADVVLGWDIGGAHLKVAAVDRNGKVAITAPNTTHIPMPRSAMTT